jgi:uncharacterized protein YjiK
VLLLLSCQTGERTNISGAYFTSARISFSYDLQNPDRRIVLPSELQEVSALSWLGDDLLGMVQDERGKIYEFDVGEEEVREDYRFWENEDYEGIEMVNGIVFTLQSDGDLFEVHGYRDKEPKVWKHENPLRKKNDTEGLGYDAQTNSLLVACKASPHLEGMEGLKGSRAVYAFDLDKRKLRKKPFLVISLDSIRKVLNEGPVTAFSRRFVNALGDDLTFKPSGIAQHPQTGDFWIISSVGKLLVVVNRNGKIVYVERLRSGLFNHPEGICFSPNGTLFVSNEGDEGVPSLLIFRKLKN